MVFGHSLYWFVLRRFIESQPGVFIVLRALPLNEKAILPILAWIAKIDNFLLTHSSSLSKYQCCS